MSTKLKSFARRLGQGYLGHVVADARSPAAPSLFGPGGEGAAGLVGPGEADTGDLVVADLAVETQRYRGPPAASVLPGTLADHESQAEESGPPEAAEPVVEKIRTSRSRAGRDSGEPKIAGRARGGREIDDVKPSKGPKSDPSRPTHEGRERASAGSGNLAGMRERTTTYKITKKDGGLKVESAPYATTGPEIGALSGRAAPTGGKSLKSPKAPKSLDPQAVGPRSERPHLGPDREARADGRALPDRSGTPEPGGGEPRSERGAEPTAAEPTSARPHFERAASAQPHTERALSATPESRPAAPAGPQAAVVARPRRELRRSGPGQGRERGPRVEIGSVDVQVIMEGPEPPTQKVASRPQPYIGSSRASRLYQRRL